MCFCAHLCFPGQAFSKMMTNRRSVAANATLNRTTPTPRSTCSAPWRRGELLSPETVAFCSHRTPGLILRSQRGLQRGRFRPGRSWGQRSAGGGRMEWQTVSRFSHIRRSCRCECDQGFCYNDEMAKRCLRRASVGQS